ncbi:hypothetical protein BHU72_14490 [Desulfuribacillus stibiiarsenatis]|uniref:Uncharacterized protein n=1 Tax=Desulfuribacillus stibiiarsenatis TaxID=1390249 RepID=A0A1E5L7B3_9FIRM|nr:hypothetical protein [Desulfuribacillus stibiiarsenatis]OEH86037.1 hypothetical protein BHU72_14490 [Desulfuribacillus stibiiarsenatis]
MGLYNILESLYEYEIMTAKQLAIVNGYKLKTVYEYIHKLSTFKDKHAMEVTPKIRKIDLATKRGAKAYYLAPRAAKEIAEARNEVHYFREKEWETVPGAYYNILVTNQVICEIIQSGILSISEWTGRKTLLKRYTEDEKGYIPVFNALFECQNNTNLGYEKRIVYLSVISAKTDKSVIREMMNTYYDILRMSYEGGSNKILLLFVYMGKKLHQELLSSWSRFFVDKADAPYFAVASFEELGKEGVLSSVWQTSQSSERTSIVNMPYYEIKQEIAPVLGVLKVDDELQYIQGFHM